jgi:hypothetical protein
MRVNHVEPSATANTTGDGVGSSLSRNVYRRREEHCWFHGAGHAHGGGDALSGRITEMTCYDIIKPMLEQGVVTVGTRVVIDHLAASRVGSTLVVDATRRSPEKNRHRFVATITDGARTVARIEHERAALTAQTLVGGLG